MRRLAAGGGGMGDAINARLQAPACACAPAARRALSALTGLPPSPTPGKFADVQNAYEVLTNDQKRAAYNQFGHSAVDGSNGSGEGGPFGGGGGGEGFMDAEELFAQFFGGGRGGGGGRAGRSRAAPSGPRRGADVQVPLSLSFMEAVHGCTKSITTPIEEPCAPCEGTGSADKSKPVACSACKGSGQQTVQDGFFTVAMACRKCGGEGTSVKSPCRACGASGRTRGSKSVQVEVPAGVESGVNLKLSAQGSAGERGGPAGHIYVVLRVEADPFFEREGADVHVTVPLSIATLVLGGSVPVPTVRGEVELTVPPGTQPADTLVMRGRGIKRLNGGPPGHQYVHLKLLVPKTLTRKQEAAMREFAAEEAAAVATGSDDGNRSARGFLQETVERIRRAVKGSGGGDGNK